MISKADIKAYIKKAVKDTIGSEPLDGDASLLGAGLNIPPAGFLYIFDILEQQLRLPICDVFTNHSFDVMSVDNLTDAIYEMQTREQRIKSEDL
jgi:hypothetical protein